MYRTNWGIGHGLKDILEAHKGPFTGQGHKGLYEILTTSWHAQLSLNLAMLGSLTIVVAHHMYSMPPYPYLATDYGTQLSLFTHHMWIGGFLIVGAAAHAAIFMVRDYDPTTRYNDLLDRVLRHRDAIISHLNWACIFLGFHSFGLYIHNDTMSALGRPQDMFSDTAIQLQPVFAQWIQNTHALAPGATAPGATASTSLTWGGGDLVAVGGKVALLPIPLGTADFLVHHIHAFTIHVTVLILLKGVLFARSSRLIPDKANLGFRFPCDGPGRGGTCQVSAWDHVFLGLFWMYNSISVVIFHFSWKMQSDVWGSVSDQGVVTHITGGNFAQSSITINGWLRDFLWAQASQDPLHVRPIAHAIWDPHFGQPAVEAFTRGGALGPVNIAYSGQWNLYAQNPDSSSHLFGTAEGAGTAILTLLGGFHPQTQSLWLTDIAHHHLAIAFIFLVAGHMYRTNFGIGHSMKDLLDAHIPPGGRLGRGHKGLYDTINNSLHFQLGLALASLGVITSLVAQHMYSLPAYAFIAQDFTTQAALYTHHQYIAGFIMTGAFAHGAIFFIRDYNPEQNEDNVLARMLDHKEAIISHLSWASLFLGFHTLGLYVHNDVMLAFGTPEKQILIEPIFAQWIQSAHGKTSYGFDVLLSSTTGPAFNAGRSIWLPGWLNAVNENSNSLFLTIGPGDFLVHHAIALGLHTTTLILVKGRGGTCDISAWDAFYLAVFWMLNTIGWVTFYWHWKHITLWQGNVSQFNESSTYLMGWLRDYLWLNSSQLINGYNPFGMNSLSVWAWMFLFGHLVWATGFMFLISWRGYWQELIETLAWAHERTPLANLIRWRDKPVALSIVQARLVGLAHFSDSTCIMDTNRNSTIMARKSLIQREKKRQKLEQKYHSIRRSSKKEISKVPSLSDKWEIYGKLQSLPRNSAPTRLHRRCFLTGRPRANYRDFGLSGHILREMVHACLLPGATRSSW
ncbi:hypothetical protein RDI58_032702 [Solanum bulbocastanum]|uniref:Small ribosomal subunit protein uS14c n=1 Tax=Solanum bulbocastanum TaxID=147425 RepID=A0AAN8XX37_SOLBU